MSVQVRLLIASLCAIALVTGGVFLERLGPRPVDAGELQEPISGAWSCPHGGGEGWRVWVAIANPGTDPVQVRTTTSAGGASAPATTSEIAPGTLQEVEVSAPINGSATVVEYLGGTVAAGSVVQPPEGGLSAEPCVGTPGTHWLVPEFSTLRGETSYLVVHNPYAAQAVVDVILTTTDDQIRPGRLQGVVLGPLDARAFELNNLALGEKALAAEVVAPQGRVSVASVVIGSGSARSSLGVAAESTRWILPGAGAETEVVIRAPHDQDAPVGAEIQGAEGSIPALDLEVVSAATAQAFGLLLSDGGFFVHSEGGGPMVAGRRMFLAERAPAPEPNAPEEEPSGENKGEAKDADKKGAKPAPPMKGGQKEGNKEEPAPEPQADIAATSGAPQTGDRWLVLPPVPPEGGPSVILIQNPGTEEVTVSVALFGTNGPVDASQEVTVQPGSTVRVPIPDDAPAAALIEGGEIVAASASLTPGAFAVALGISI